MAKSKMRGDGPANLTAQPKLGITGPANFLRDRAKKKSAAPKAKKPKRPAAPRAPRTPMGIPPAMPSMGIPMGGGAPSAGGMGGGL